MEGFREPSMEGFENPPNRPPKTLRIASLRASWKGTEGEGGTEGHGGTERGPEIWTGTEGATTVHFEYNASAFFHPGTYLYDNYGNKG